MAEDYLDLRVYFDILLRRRRVILLLVLLFAGVAYAYSRTLPSEYRAATGLVVAPNRANLTLSDALQLSAEDGQRVDLRYRNAALLEVARSIQIAQAVLVQEPDLVTALNTSNPARVARMMDISGKDDWISIQAKAPTPRLATQLARAWVHETANRINTLYAVDAVVEANLEAEAATAWEDYLQTQTALEDFLRGSSSAEIEGQIRRLETSLAWTTLDVELVNTYRQEALLKQLLLDAEALKLRLQRDAVATPDWGVAVAFINLQSQAFGGQLAGQSFQQSDTLGSLSFSLPGTISGNWQFDLSGAPPAVTVADVEALIAVLNGKLATVQAQLAETFGTGSGLQERAPQIEVIAQELTLLRAQWEQEQARQLQLSAVRDAAWQTYTALVNKLREVRVERAVAIQEVQVAFEPFPPLSRSAPKVSINTAIGAVAGLLLGVVWALGQAYLGQGLVIKTRVKLLDWGLNASGLPNFTPVERAAAADAARFAAQSAGMSATSE